MNVFISGTGRCGTTTFSKACQHLDNYTSGHETRVSLLGSNRIRYANNHIECDPRLTWYLPQLAFQYPDSFYVHLRRNEEATIKSLVRKEMVAKKLGQLGLLHGWAMAINMRHSKVVINYDELMLAVIAKDYVNCVNTIIDTFFKSGVDNMIINLENIKQDFPLFLDKIGAKGNLAKAIDEWNMRHNAG